MKNTATGDRTVDSVSANSDTKSNSNNKMTIASRLLGVVGCGALLFAGACGGSSGSNSTTTTTTTPTTTTPTGSNVQAIIGQCGTSGQLRQWGIYQRHGLRAGHLHLSDD
jgi:hypothetical protein